jgi:hypothetical protein
MFLRHPPAQEERHDSAYSLYKSFFGPISFINAVIIIDTQRKGSPGAGFIGDPVQPLVGQSFHFNLNPALKSYFS